MFSFLLVIIYVAFISLGLPDSLVGSAWPVMQSELGVPFSYAGIITMIIACGTIVSSLLSDRLTRKFGAGLVTAFSVFLTAMALFGFLASAINISIFPLYLSIFAILMLVMSERLNKIVAKKYASSR